MSWLKRRLPTKRWKRIRIYLASLFIILLAADMLLVQYWRHINIAYDTTRITVPLNAEGMPDYIAAQNAEASQGVTPENNAAPDLLQLTGTEKFSQSWREHVLPQIGMSSKPLPPLFTSYESWLNARHAASQPENAVDHQKYLDEEEGKIRKSPWKSSDFPDRLAWLSAQRMTLSKLHAALMKDHLYIPWNTNAPDVFAAASLEVGLIQWPSNCRGCCEYLLAADAMRAVGDGNVEAFHRDVTDLLRLSRLIAQSSTLVEYLSAVAIEDDGWQTLREGVVQPHFLQAADATALLREALAVSTFPDGSRTLDRGERFFSLDMACRVSKGGLNRETGDLSSQILSLIFRSVVPMHYNQWLRTFNHYFDELVAAYKLPNYKERIAASEAIEKEAVDRRSWFSVGDLLVAVLISFDSIVKPPETAIMDRQLAQVALALRIYHEDHGQYPTILQDLSPKILPALPLDGFADAPFHYRRDGDGYLLYSVGPDGKDDGGQERKPGVKGYDLVVHASE